MASREQIHAFAVRQSATLLNAKTELHEMEDVFPNECLALGFCQDHGKALAAAFPETDVLNDSRALSEILCLTTDISMLGNAILSRWLYYSQGGYRDFLLSKENRSWLLLALGRLAELTSEDSASPRRIDSCTKDRIERIAVLYERTTALRSLGKGEVVYVSRYSEELFVDRSTETITHALGRGSAEKVKRQYTAKYLVSDLLKRVEADELFTKFAVQNAAAPNDPDEAKMFSITVDYAKRPQRVINGTFDSNGLPLDWPVFSEALLRALSLFRFGELFDVFASRQGGRAAGDYMFCSVEFSEGGKSYYYLSKDDSLFVGDLVWVPVGSQDHVKTAKIVDIEYYSEEEVPFPLHATKEIIEKRGGGDDATDEPTDRPEAEKPAAAQQSPIEKPLPSFDYLELCDEKTPQVSVRVWASMQDGCLTISGQDFGEMAQRFFGDDEYEYSYDFDRDDTKRLLSLLPDEGQGVIDRLLKAFSGMEGCRRMKELCAQNGIEYRYFSC